MSNRCQVASSKRLGARNKEQVTRTGLGTVAWQWDISIASEIDSVVCEAQYSDNFIAEAGV